MEQQKKKVLFQEALFLTTSHILVLVIKKCVFVKTTSIHYFMPPPFENPGSTIDNLPHVSYSHYVLPHAKIFLRLCFFFKWGLTIFLI